MNQKILPATIAEILKKRNLLQKLSQASFSFSQINKRYPLEQINTEEEGQAVLDFYKSLEDELTALFSEKHAQSTN